MRPGEGAPKILLLDIETTPDLSWVWGAYEQNAIEIEQHSYLLSYSAKWRGGKHITRGLPDTGCKDDSCLTKEIRELLDQADVVVAHNGKDFDVRKLNARFIFHGLTPPSPYDVIDTKRELQRIARFSSNKLDWIAAELGLSRKFPHEGFALWKGCMTGDPKAWRKMLRYNRHDIVILERLYERLSPWMRQPNPNVYQSGVVCPNLLCKSKDLARRGSARSRTRVYQRFQCKKCGAWARAVRSNPHSAAVTSI